MKDLLIVSTYGSEAIRDWWPTQKHFIKKYTKNYDFGVFLHDVEDETPFKNNIVIGRATGNLLYTLPEMFHQIYHYFRKNEYRNYLLLDSDCFPIKEDWLYKILSLTEDYWYAAPVRTDNLDTVPHPCALFVRGEYIKEHLFYFRRPSVGKMVNLIGEEVHDIGTGFKTEVNGKQIFFPLLRSNFMNVHPMLAAIYGDLFYHHGAGSRLPWFRSTPYWKKVVGEHYRDGVNCYHELIKNPEEFVSNLRYENSSE